MSAERIVWIDATAGAAGDMILAALIDAGAPLGAVRRAVAGLRLPGVRLAFTRVMRAGVSAARVEVKVRGSTRDDRHLADGAHGRSLRAIRSVIARGGLPPAVRDRALVVFGRLFEAEALAHGLAPASVHLHEAGAADAIADIVGCAAALHALAPDRIHVSPVTTGSGSVACAHGILPVPGPATAVLLRGVPLSGIEAEGERLTPTGAAILTSIAGGWGGPPAMTLGSIGVGAGSRDDPHRPNVVRVLVGEREARHEEAPPPDSRSEVVVVEFTVDDATPQLLAFAAERLREAGALDLHIVPALMKKGRPGHLVTVLSPPEAFGAVARAALTETTTLGLRWRREGRVELDRAVERVTTPYGAVRVKSGRRDGVELHAWPEFEDCAAAARRHGVPLHAVQQAALSARGRPAAPRRGRGAR